MSSINPNPTNSGTPWLLMLLLSLAAALPARGQQVWTLDACLHYAVQQSPHIKKQMLQKRIYDQEYKESVASLFPSLRAGTSLSTNFGRSINPATNTYENVSNLNNVYQLTASLPLFDGLSSWYNIRFREAGKERGLKEVEQAKEQLALDVMQAYYDGLYYQKLVQLAEEQLVQSKQELVLTNKRESLGLAAGADRAQMEAKVAADSFNLVRQTNLQHLSLIHLKELMNYPLRSELRMDTLLTPILPQTTINNLEQMKSYAATMLPEAAQSLLLIQEAKLQHKMAQGSLFPYITLSGGISTNYFENLNETTEQTQSFSSQFKNNSGEYLTVTLSVPLFTNLTNLSRIKRSKYQYHQAKLEHQATINRLEKEVEQAVADLIGTGKEYLQAQKQAYALQLAHQVNQRKYQEGLISAIELFVSANQTLQAEADRVGCHIRYLLKEKLVNYYGGIPLIPL